MRNVRGGLRRSAGVCGVRGGASRAGRAGGGAGAKGRKRRRGDRLRQTFCAAAVMLGVPGRYGGPGKEIPHETTHEAKSTNRAGAGGAAAGGGLPGLGGAGRAAGGCRRGQRRGAGRCAPGGVRTLP